MFGRNWNTFTLENSSSTQILMKVFFDMTPLDAATDLRRETTHVRRDGCGHLNIPIMSCQDQHEI